MQAMKDGRHLYEVRPADLSHNGSMTETGDEPKSAFELAMERLRKKDRDEGVEERPISGEPRAASAEVRKVYDAKLAEREILHRDALLKARDADAVAVLEEEYRRDRERMASERERKITEIRKSS